MNENNNDNYNAQLIVSLLGKLTRCSKLSLVSEATPLFLSFALKEVDYLSLCPFVWLSCCSLHNRGISEYPPAPAHEG